MLEPLKVTIVNFPADSPKEVSVPNFPADESKGFHNVPLRDTIYIEQSDFREVSVMPVFSYCALGVCSTVIPCWTAGQLVERSILHKGHDS